MAGIQIYRNVVVPSVHDRFKVYSRFIVGWYLGRSFVTNRSFDSYVSAYEAANDLMFSYPERQYHIIEERVELFLLDYPNLFES